MTTLRVLQEGDEVAVEDFLLKYTETSMFLRSNYQAEGLVDHGEPLQGTYVAAIEGTSILGLAAHFWNGMLVVQAPHSLIAVVTKVADVTGAPIRGLAGPWSQVIAARRVLGLDEARTALNSCEDLFSLRLADLVVPSLLLEGAVTTRQPHPDELDRLAGWHVRYCVETLGAEENEDLFAKCRAEMRRLQREGNHWVLVSDGAAVAYCAFNARLPDSVQIGGVWTPPTLRGRGYARSVVAGALLEAREAGVIRSTLFTGQDNEPARRAYQALGFSIIGNYGLILFANPAAYPSS